VAVVKVYVYKDGRWHTLHSESNLHSEVAEELECDEEYVLEDD